MDVQICQRAFVYRAGKRWLLLINGFFAMR